MSARLSPSELAAFEAFCAESGRKPSEVVKAAVLAYIAPTAP